MALRIVRVLADPAYCGYAAIIRNNPDWDEHIVQYSLNGRLLSESCWTHCPADESIDTAKFELAFLAAKLTPTEVH